MQTCSKCKIDKPLSEFHFRKDSGKYRTICKSCWGLKSSARRLGITEEQALDFYKSPKCLCCGEELPLKKQRHLHHVNHKVKGVLCKYCNTSLEQESTETKNRIEACIKFIGSNRENLFDRVNQQGSRQTEPDPSTTTRRAQSERTTCKICKRKLSKSDFYLQNRTDGQRRPIARCKECQKIYVKSKQYDLTFEQVQHLRQRSHCDCCGVKLDIPYIHHIEDKVLGAVCPKCNILLEQESEVTKHKLRSCASWLVMI